MAKESCWSLLCSVHHTSFVSMTDSAISTLSGVSCTLFRPLLMAPFSIGVILYMNLMLCLESIAWLWPKPGCCVGDLRRHRYIIMCVCMHVCMHTQRILKFKNMAEKKKKKARLPWKILNFVFINFVSNKGQSAHTLNVPSLKHFCQKWVERNAICRLHF